VVIMGEQRPPKSTLTILCNPMIPGCDGLLSANKGAFGGGPDFNIKSCLKQVKKRKLRGFAYSLLDDSFGVCCPLALSMALVVIQC
jgi:hypothetical protein